MGKQFQGEKGMAIQYGASDGSSHKLVANDAGIVTAKTPEDEERLALMGLKAIDQVAPKATKKAKAAQPKAIKSVTEPATPAVEPAAPASEPVEPAPQPVIPADKEV